jgi:hypothetical protein
MNDMNGKKKMKNRVNWRNEMNAKIIGYALSLMFVWTATAFAVEDGLGTNHVQTLRAYDGIVLRDETKITGWSDISSSTLTNQSISTDMLQDNAVTEAKIAGSVAGDGLTGGAGAPLAVDPALGLEIDGGGQLAVDATVVRTVDNFAIGGEITFTNAVIVPTSSTASHAASVEYVDDSIGNFIADGVAESETLRWNGTSWATTDGLTVDATGNTAISGTLGVTGVTTVSNFVATGTVDVTGPVGVTGAVDVTGTLGVSDDVALDSATGSSDTATGALVVVGGVGVGENLNVGGDVDVTGAATVDGALTATGRIQADGPLATTPTGTTASPLAITAVGGVDDISRSYAIIRGDGGSVTVSANPRIATTGAVPGQMLTLQGQSDTDWVKLDNGNGLVLANGISFTLKAGHIIQFIYDGAAWRETFRTVPAP